VEIFSGEVSKDFLSNELLRAIVSESRKKKKRKGKEEKRRLTMLNAWQRTRKYKNGLGGVARKQSGKKSKNVKRLNK